MLDARRSMVDVFILFFTIYLFILSSLIPPHLHYTSYTIHKSQKHKASVKRNLCASPLTYKIQNILSVYCQNIPFSFALTLALALYMFCSFVNFLTFSRLHTAQLSSALITSHNKSVLFRPIFIKILYRKMGKILIKRHTIGKSQVYKNRVALCII